MPLARVGSNGGHPQPEPHEPPCDDLVDLRTRIGSLESRQATFMARIDTRTGEMLQAAGEAAEHAKDAARYSKRACDAAEKVAERTYAPVNDVLAKYQDSVPPASDDVGENTRNDIFSPYAAKARIRAEQQKAATAELELKRAKTKLYGALAGILVPLGLALYAVAKAKGWMP